MNINVEPKFTSLESYLTELVDSSIFEKEIKHRLKDTDLPRLDDATSDSLVLQLLSTFRQTCADYTSQVTFEEIGTVQHIGNGVATLSGLSNVGVDELVTFPNGIDGLVLNLEADTIDVILLGEETGIHGGDRVTSKRQRIRVPVGPDLLGRVIDPLGAPLDGLPAIQPVDMEMLEKPAPGIIERSPVNEPLQTGIKMIDALFSVGRGQRELIVGDRQIRQDHPGSRHDPQPEKHQRGLHLCFHRPEKVLCVIRYEYAERTGRHGIFHDHNCQPR